MQTARIGQAVSIFLVAWMAGGCAATKEYSSKLFAPRTTGEETRTAQGPRFLDMEEAAMDSANWVSTDIITGRDTSNRSTVLDAFAKKYPPGSTPDSKPDSVISKAESRPVLASSGQKPETTQPVARASTGEGTVRAKKSRED